jgi:hypothetical protein
MHRQAQSPRALGLLKALATVVRDRTQSRASPSQTLQIIDLSILNVGI